MNIVRNHLFFLQLINKPKGVHYSISIVATVKLKKNLSTKINYYNMINIIYWVASNNHYLK